MHLGLYLEHSNGYINVGCYYCFYYYDYYYYFYFKIINSQIWILEVFLILLHCTLSLSHYQF